MALNHVMPQAGGKMDRSNWQAAECVHYWIIQAPEGPTSIGRCKYCGLEREFSNMWTDSFNEHQILSENASEVKKKESVEITT